MALKLFGDLPKYWLVVMVLLFPLSTRAAEPAHLSITIDGIPYYAVLRENHELLALIDTSTNASAAKHYRGELLGYPESAVRVTWARGAWRGLVFLSGQTYRINQFDDSEVSSAISRPVFAHAVVSDPDGDAFCATAALGQSPERASSPALSSASAILPVAATTACDNAINDICLLPHIEFAYDQSYQALPYLGLTPFERAVQDINEMEVFFEIDFGYRFSQLSLTMLSPAEEVEISISKNPYTLVADLWADRSAGLYDGFLQSQRSIFHLVTGRDFDPVNSSGQIDFENGTNVIGIAYPGTVCFSNGQNVGTTDAGDASVGNVDDLSRSIISRVIAHEIGHNLGVKEHDGTGDNTCPSGSHLMSAQISSSLNGFSACSINDIKTLVGSPSSQCFDYPIDLAISERCGSVSEPQKGTVFQAGFVVTRERRDSSGVATQIGIYGEIPDADQGRFMSVEAAGNSCVVAVDQLSYQCSLLNPPTSLELTISITINEIASEFLATHQVYSEASALVDVDSANNAVEQFYNTFSPQGGTVPVSVCPGGASQSGNDDEGSARSGGGGGGSSGLLLLLLLAMRLPFLAWLQSNG